MKVLIISSNILPASSPSGPAYIAGAALKAGHEVEVFESLFASDLTNELEQKIAGYNPDVIGISIRLVTGTIYDESWEFNLKPFDLRPKIREIVNCIKGVTDASIVLGGCGFNYFGQDWLEYLDLDYGIRGEAEFSFPLYLKSLEEGGDIDSIPGSIFKKNGQTCKVSRDLIENLDATAFPAYELFDLDKYQENGVSPSIFTKRGCSFHCTFCPYRSLEGVCYRVKSPKRVVDEIKHIQNVKKSKIFTFCDNSFNVPKRHAEEICKELIRQEMNIKWGTGSLKPLGITENFCQLLKDAGCSYINLAVETASEKMLKNMKRGYRTEHIKNALSCLSKAELPFGITLMIGAPGETQETITESFELIDGYKIPLESWATIGICLWTHHQNILQDARKDGQLKDDKDLFNGVYYISPELPKNYMLDLIRSLQARKKWKIHVNKLYA